MLVSPGYGEARVKAGEGRGRDSLAVQRLRLYPPSAGARFHPQPGSWIPHAATKTQCSQIHNFFFLKSGGQSLAPACHCFGGIRDPSAQLLPLLPEDTLRQARERCCRLSEGLRETPNLSAGEDARMCSAQQSGHVVNGNTFCPGRTPRVLCKNWLSQHPLFSAFLQALCTRRV